MRTQRLFVLLAIVCLVGISLMLLGSPVIEQKQKDDEKPAPPPSNNLFENAPPEKSKERPVPAQGASDKLHPIAQLFDKANKDFNDMRARQSKTLKEAVEEYRRRYKMPPPPNFDVWFRFAQKRGVQVIDDYDTIYHALLPFWGLDPKLVRDRAREAIGFDNAVIGVLIRNGKVSKTAGGGEGDLWKRTALGDMMESFIQYLPDMDLAFNIHDEPRVVISNEDLQRLVTRAVDGALPKAYENPSLKNTWSRRPDDVNKGDRIDEFRTTRFNRFAHQPTWTHSRMSCPAGSPARNLDEAGVDDTAAYSYNELGFLYNTTAFSDICLTPSLRYTFGFFDRPNALDIVHDLFPIFSQSKVSSYQDILYPSPWYWTGKVTYEPEKDFLWNDKKNQMYWRGSTTGGFSRAGGWRRQHRQLFVKKINGFDTTKVYEKGPEGVWSLKETPRRTFSDIFNVKFSHVGQCDPEDCKAQMEFFDVVESAGQQDAWAYKHLVDIDGNAFSGRYYAFLHSNSLVYKLAIFREWHDEWIRPWVHYVPLSLQGNEHVETVRYLATEEEGQSYARLLAKQGKEFAEKALRNDDLEVWFFRLLLEYGRVVDDNRENIGLSLT
ncbi:hypothetical protein AJ79_01224 [Helicocarpus griseus UAMH5409]|uniref:Glycosyl transferase CAP10 domain-containing protein n=1 Tax=Helicocarpus griseus UAMH5409 TaxID=1447875 RepID=A0A2B7Y805_9EURO|nr:hypothetical protein AJ79_01224 [Helicocarpus griseus UAMH5409]